MQHLIIASTSTLHGGSFLNYLMNDLTILFKKANTILFIPYARPGGISHDEYTQKAKLAFKTIDKNVIGIHEFDDPKNAIENAEGIYVGGGNTFVLIGQLYQHKLIEPLQNVIQKGTPYLGTSAGSNICGQTISTTNDMPIVYPPSFNVLGIVPFNINPHYLDLNPNSTHMGETRETRILEFHQFNHLPVIGLREGSFLEVKDEIITLKGDLPARVFKNNKIPYEIEPNSIIQF